MLMLRNIQIDFLRFLAITLVIMLHSGGFTNSNIINQIYNTIARGGWIGVDLFFVLSGFLITSLVLNEYKASGKFDVKKFLIRRGIKIYPLFYFFLVFQFCYSAYLGKPQSSINLLYEATFIANYTALNNLFLWSICVEEHFYLIICMFAYFFQTHKAFHPKIILKIYVFTLLLGFCIRMFNYIEFQNYDFYRDYIPTHLRIHGLFAGAALAYFNIYKPNAIAAVIDNRILNSALLLLSVAFLLINFIWNLDEDIIVSTLCFTTNPICFAFILINLITMKNSWILSLLKPMAYIGKYSYSIYLFHIFFLSVKYPFIHNYGLMFVIIRFAGIFIGGIVISKLIEYPILKLRDRYIPSNAKLSLASS